MIPAAILLPCKAILIPLPHKGVIIPAASPIISRWFSTCDFLSKLICEIVSGSGKMILLSVNIFFKNGFWLKIVRSISAISPLVFFRLSAVVR